MDKTNDIHDGIVFAGGAVKAAGIVDGKGILEGYAVIFDEPGNPAARDLSGQYFTGKTYLGPRDGDGADGTFHHTLPVKGIEFAAEHLFAPVKTVRDDIGLFTQVVLDMSDKYERAVYKAGAKGLFGFSSGTALHMIRLGEDGEIKRWPIVEIALTPTPCEPRARATAMKALQAEAESEEVQTFAGAFKAIFDSQEEAEEVYQYVAEQRDRLEEENWKLRELEAIQREAILLHAEILRHATSRLR